MLLCNTPGNFDLVDWSQPLAEHPLNKGLHHGFVVGGPGYGCRQIYNLVPGRFYDSGYPNEQRPGDLPVLVANSYDSTPHDRFGSDEFGPYVTTNAGGRNSESIWAGDDALFNATENFVISCTLRWIGATSTDEDDIFGHWTVSNLHFLFRYDSNIAKIECQIYAGGGFSSSVSYNNTDLSDGLPHNVACRWDGANIHVWKDGVKSPSSGSRSGTLGQGSGSRRHYWGWASQGSSQDSGRWRFYDGRVYRNHQLSDSMIETLSRESLTRFPNLLNRHGYAEVEAPSGGHPASRRFGLCRHINQRVYGAEGVQVL